MLYRDTFCFVIKNEDNFNIMCGEFVITITNNDNVSVTQYKPSSNIPQVFIVSTIDELPTNTVDGAVGIIKNDDILGDWYLNITPDVRPFDYYFNFESKSRDGSKEAYNNFWVNDQILYYSNEEVGAESEVYNNELGWLGYGYRFITILEKPNSKFAETWIRTNGRKLSLLYTKENGQWVYKGEIV